MIIDIIVILKCYLIFLYISGMSSVRSRLNIGLTVYLITKLVNQDGGIKQSYKE